MQESNKGGKDKQGGKEESSKGGKETKLFI
jgi:hypothetical protein